MEVFYLIVQFHLNCLVFKLITTKNILQLFFLALAFRIIFRFLRYHSFLSFVWATFSFASFGASKHFNNSHPSSFILYCIYWFKKKERSPLSLILVHFIIPDFIYFNNKFIPPCKLNIGRRFNNPSSQSPLNYHKSRNLAPHDRRSRCSRFLLSCALRMKEKSFASQPLRTTPSEGFTVVGIA